MSLKTIKVLLVLLAGFGQTSFAQPDLPVKKETIVQVCDRFMDAFVRGNYDSAFKAIKPYSVAAEAKNDTMPRVIKRQMTELTLAYGKMLSFEKVSETAIKNDFIKLTYVAKLEKLFMEVNFIAYNGSIGWTIIRLNCSAAHWDARPKASP